MGEGEMQIVPMSDSEDCVWRTKKSLLADGFWPLSRERWQRAKIDQAESGQGNFFSFLFWNSQRLQAKKKKSSWNYCESYHLEKMTDNICGYKLSNSLWEILHINKFFFIKSWDSTISSFPVMFLLLLQST